MEYTAKTLAAVFGKTEYAAHYWQRAGIIQPVRKGRNGQFLYDEKAVEAIRAYRKKKTVVLNSERSRETLCWTCINAYGGCSWSSKARKPVKGWKAKRIDLKGYPESTYKVLACPEYEKELFRRDEKGIRHRVNEIPAVNSR